MEKIKCNFDPTRIFRLTGFNAYIIYSVNLKVKVICLLQQPENNINLKYSSTSKNQSTIKNLLVKEYFNAERGSSNLRKCIIKLI